MERPTLMLCDFHCHSSLSDGTLRPEDLVERAKRAGVRALALTDHDDVRGIEPARERARALGIEFLAGVELSVSDRGGRWEMHLLGLGIDPEAADLRRWGSDFREERERRAERIVERLNRAGVEISLERVREEAGEAAFTRTHLARTLVSIGACRDLEHAFRRYLRRGRGAFVPRTGLAVREAVRAIHTAGGVAVLAHPPHSRGPDAPGGLEAFVGQLAALGLDGLEVQHPSHTQSQRRRLRRLAAQYELLETGGSDFHGANKPGVEIGTGRAGNVRVGPEVFEAILERRARVQAARA
jgi:predicted metal-dependent phosphoesterase TrpH